MKKKFVGIILSGVVTLSSIVPSFASEVYTSYKDKSYIDNFNGIADISKRINTEFSNEASNSLTSTQVIVETPEVSGSGTLFLSGQKNTSYRDIDTDAIVDVKLGIYAPIIYGDDIDVEIDDSSSIEAENTSTNYFYSENYTYINPIRLKDWRY